MIKTLYLYCESFFGEKRKEKAWEECFAPVERVFWREENM
jgi:hypothetical protein